MISRTFWQKFSFPVTIAIMALASFLYVYLPLGGWTWETVIPRSFPAAAIDVPEGTSTVTLTYDVEHTTSLSFAIAENEGAVRELWAGGGVAKEAPNLAACNTSPSSNGLACSLTDARVHIMLPTATPASINTGGAAPLAVRPRRTLWIVPYHITTYGTIHSVAALHWTRVEVARQGAPADVQAAACVNPQSDERDGCLFAEDLLRRPLLTLDRNPERMIAKLAEYAAPRLIPAFVTMMTVINLSLLGLVVGLGAVWMRGYGLIQRATDGQIIDATTVWRSRRRVLEFLEVFGPASAFAATVCGLLLAFDPQVFAEKDGFLFGVSIRMAMSACFVGLCMRILAVIADKMIEHLVSWNADDDGFIRPVTATAHEHARSETALARRTG